MHPISAPTKEELIAKAKKSLLIALMNNNEISAKAIIARFPELDLNQITDKEGRRPLSIVIQSETYSQNDCLPLLNLLLANKVDVNLPDNNAAKEAPISACTPHQHYIDIRSMGFLLVNGANPNSADADNYTPLHRAVRTYRTTGARVEEAIELLLVHGANPDALTCEGTKAIDMIIQASEKNQIPAIFENTTKQKNNLLDAALALIVSDKNRMLFLRALKSNYIVRIGRGERAFDLNITDLFESIQKRKDLTVSARNKLAVLNFYLDEYNLSEKQEFSANESNTLYKLSYNLYKADLDITNGILQASTEFKDTKELHDAASKIQFWARKKIKRNNESVVALSNTI